VRVKRDAAAVYHAGLPLTLCLRICSPEEARDLASQMIGNKLITKQTGAGGRICNAVMLAEAREPAHEYYVALLNDRASQLPVLVASNQGGMNIEDVAKDSPDAIITTPINFETGLDMETALGVAKKLGFSSEKQEKQAAETFIKLYKLFKEKDATQVEINPMAESKDGEVLW
jgi:succinyl-CoA synthetase beta subunit